MQTEKRSNTPLPFLFTILILALALPGPLRAQEEGQAPTAQPPAAAPTEPEEEPPPIEWLPWSDELFAKARKDGRGVLLSVVTPWCKSCDMMDRDVWSDIQVRRYVAAYWVPIRVNSEERPDLDSRYQKALAALNRGKGGYPLTAFLFPTGEAMWADLTIPARNLEERPGLQTLLPRMALFWRQRFESAKQNAMRVQGTFNIEGEPRHTGTPSAELFSAIVDGMIGREDREFGGYGPAPRANNPGAARLLLRASFRRADEGLQRRAADALLAAVRGAVYDRIEGGFHAGSLDRTWEAPIFGKTLKANARYLLALVPVVAATGEPELEDAVRRTVDYLLKTLQSPEGGFYSRQGPSADEKDHATFYAWTLDEVKESLDDSQERWARLLFGLNNEGEILLGLPRRFTLKMRTSIQEAARTTGVGEIEIRLEADRIVEILAGMRGKRQAPPVRSVRYTDGNALAVSALLRAGVLLEREEAIQAALKGLALILESAPDPAAGVPHRIDKAPQPSPLLMADLAFLGNALVDAHEVTGDPGHLEAAKAAGLGLNKLYYDGEGGGGFFDVVEQPDSAGYVRIRRKVLGDGRAPSPQAAALRLLVRLAAHTGEEEPWQTSIEPSLAWCAPRVIGLDERSANFALVLDETQHSDLEATISGEGAAANALARTAWLLRDDSTVVRRRTGAGAATASLCLGQTCREGIGSPAEMKEAAAALQGRGGVIAGP